MLFTQLGGTLINEDGTAGRSHREPNKTAMNETLVFINIYFKW